MKEVFTEKTFKKLYGKEIEKNLLSTIDYVYTCGNAFKTIDEIIKYFDVNGKEGIEKMKAELMQKYDAEEKTVTLTKGQWSRLTCYLLMSTNYRKDTAETWRSLAEEKDEDGKTKYKNAESNAAFWDETIEMIEEIAKKIDEQ